MVNFTRILTPTRMCLHSSAPLPSGILYRLCVDPNCLINRNIHDDPIGGLCGTTDEETFKRNQQSDLFNDKQIFNTMIRHI